MQDQDPLGLLGQGGGLLSLCDVPELQDALGRCLGLAARAGSSLQAVLTAISPLSQTSITASTCAPSAWTWCSPATRAPSPSTGWAARSPGRTASERAPTKLPGSAAPS